MILYCNTIRINTKSTKLYISLLSRFCDLRTKTGVTLLINLKVNDYNHLSKFYNFLKITVTGV